MRLSEIEGLCSSVRLSSPLPDPPNFLSVPSDTVWDCMKFCVLADLTTSASDDCFSFGTIRLAANDSALLLAKFTVLTCAEANLPAHDYELDAFYFVLLAAPIFTVVFFALLIIVSTVCCEFGLLSP